MIVDIKDNFEKEVLNFQGKVIVDFYATWCMPCRMMAPVLEKIATDKSDIKLAKIDVDQNEDLSREYGVMSIPTIKIFENGKEIKTFIGVTSEEKIMEYLD